LECGMDCLHFAVMDMLTHILFIGTHLEFGICIDISLFDVVFIFYFLDQNIVT
jgi:hypothetical protein